MLKMQIIGYLGNDARVNDTNGKKVINFSVAHSEKWTDNAGVKQDRTTWVSCSLWDKGENLAQYLKKGTQVYCEGAPSVSLYTGSDRSTRADLRMNVFSLQLLGGKNHSAGNSEPAPAQATAAITITQQTPDDLPF